MSTEITQEELPADLGKISVPERLALVWDQEHFFPDSSEELTSILAIGHYSTKAGKTSALLSHVFRRQKRMARRQDEENVANGDYDAEVTIDPHATVRSMISKWAGYAILSPVRADEAERLQRKITSEYTPITQVANVRRGLSRYRSGLQVVSDFACLEEVVQGFARGKDAPAGKTKLEDFLEGPAHLNSYTMANLRPETERTITSLYVRRDFWRSVLLNDCYSTNLMTRPIIEPYLRHLVTN